MNRSIVAVDLLEWDISHEYIEREGKVSDEVALFERLSWCCSYDNRKADNSLMKFCLYGCCCPVSCCVFNVVGWFVSSNFNIAYIASDDEYLSLWRYPSGCGCIYDTRHHVQWLRHICMAGCCGVFGPNSYAGSPGTGLHAAAQFGFLQYAKDQLKYGDDINGFTIDDRKATPLILACIMKHEVIANFLIKKGASLNVRDAVGLTAMHYACRNHLKSTMFLLAAHGANIHDDVLEHPIDFITEANIISKLKSIQGDAIRKGDKLLHLISLGRLTDVIHSISFLPNFHVNKMTDDGDTLISIATKSCKKDIAMFFLGWLLEKHLSLVDMDLTRHGVTLLRWAIEDGNVNIVRHLINAGVNISHSLSGDDSFLHHAVKKGPSDVLLALLDYPVDINAVNKDRLRPFDLFTAVEKATFFLDIQFSFTLLAANEYQMWFFFIQLVDVAGIDERVFYYTQKYPQLARAIDKFGRYAEDVATSLNKGAIQRAYLWFGRYRIMDSRPEHTSKTCFVYRAWDELDRSKAGVPKAVALKLMCVKEQWQRELDIRLCDFDPEFVVEIIKSSPETNLSSTPSEVSPSVESADGIGMLSKEDAERLFLLCMPLADRNMFVALKQERWAGKNILEIRHAFTQIVKAVQHLHNKGIIHADLKTLNLVRRHSWMLIDLDASCRIGIDYIGFKSSTAIMPPEAISANYDTGHICVRSRANMPVGEAFIAHPSFDIWSLGCILYQMCNVDVRPLFDGGQDDNLSIDKGDYLNSLWTLKEWDSKFAEQKLVKVFDRTFANLISQLLSTDPLKRPTVARILQHPSLTGIPVPRLFGEKASFDVFLSYRVNSDFDHAGQLYRLLIEKGLTVWWDKTNLRVGEPWDQGFCHGLVKSRTFIALLSKEAIHSPTKLSNNWTNLSTDAVCDNVLLEHRFALELRELGFIEKICPVMIGDYDTSSECYSNFFASGGKPNAPSLSVTSVEAKLRCFMETTGLGTPFVSSTDVDFTLNTILSCQGAFIEGPRTTAFDEAAAAILTMLAPL